ncbi:MAG: hypothetical protein J6O49_04970 [Bacteroidaceae bacterium]|nr:hypothetical protein [Bacteroidaceae bacterium]
MGWSISSPSYHPLASIDSNGRFTFDRHTSDTVYTIAYNDSECGTITKDITIYACETPPEPTCVCDSFSTVGAGNTVPATIDGVEYLVGRYTGATNCSSNLYQSGMRSGTSFLGSFRFSGGNIYAQVNSANYTTSTRQGQYNIYQSSCSDYITVTQAAGSTPPASCDSCSAINIHNITPVSNVPSGTNIELATFNTDCDTTNMTASDTGGISMSNLTVVGRHSGTYQVIAGRVNPNTTSGVLGSVVSIYIGNSSTACKTFNIAQNAGTCNPNPRFSKISCVNGDQSCTVTTTQTCGATVINYQMTGGTVTTSGGFNVSTAGTYTFTPGAVMPAGNVTIKWWVLADHSVSGTTTVSCDGPCSQSQWTFTVEAKNTTSNETVYVNGVEIHTAGTTLSYTQSGRVQLVPGASTSFNNVRFTGSAGVGDSITAVALLLSCSNSGGEAPRTILCDLTGTSRTIQDGAHYRIEYNGGLGCS